jgi:hypothetical protein
VTLRVVLIVSSDVLGTAYDVVERGFESRHALEGVRQLSAQPLTDISGSQGPVLLYGAVGQGYELTIRSSILVEVPQNEKTPARGGWARALCRVVADDLPAARDRQTRRPTTR